MYVISILTQLQKPLFKKPSMQCEFELICEICGQKFPSQKFWGHIQQCHSTEESMKTIKQNCKTGHQQQYLLENLNKMFENQLKQQEHQTKIIENLSEDKTTQISQYKQSQLEIQQLKQQNNYLQQEYNALVAQLQTAAEMLKTLENRKVEGEAVLRNEVNFLLTKLSKANDKISQTKQVNINQMFSVQQNQNKNEAIEEPVINTKNKELVNLSKDFNEYNKKRSMQNNSYSNLSSTPKLKRLSQITTTTTEGNETNNESCFLKKLRTSQNSQNWKKNKNNK